MAAVKKPNRREKQILEAAGKIPANWYKLKEFANTIVFQSKSGKTQIELAK